jgi:hypothetical protein
MQAQIEKLIEDIKADYRAFIKPGLCGEEMIEQFEDNITYNEGKKYIKVLKKLGSQTMVWGFIVNVDDDAKFRKGDLLMAAGFNAPARNRARGNIIDGNYSVRWSGPEYLR